MLGEYYDEDFDSNFKDIFQDKKEPNSNNNKNQDEYLEFSTNKLVEDKKEKPKKKKKKICENCKAFTQKINELEQLNAELLKIKEKLSQENEELSQKNEELIQNNTNINNKNNELITINNKLKEEKDNLINKNKELNEDINKIKKELNAKNVKEELNKKQNENQNININNKIEIKNSNISNTEAIIPNKELIYSKKKEALNLSKFCSIEEFDKLKVIVEEMQTKINNLDEWKKTIQNKPIETIEKKEIKNIYPELNNKENDNIELNQNNNNIENKNIQKYIKKNIEDEKLQKIKSNFEEQDNISSDESNGYSNARTEQNNNIANKIKLKEKAKKKIPKKELSLKVKRISSQKKETNSVLISSNKNNNNIIPIPKKSNHYNININPYINLSSNNNNNINKKEKPKHKNQKFNSKIITNLEGLDLIARGLVKEDIDSLRNLRVGYKLIYRASEHGGEAEDFHEHCDDYKGTLIIIKTKDDNMFGGYTKVSWDEEEEGNEKKDENAFVFSINLEKLYFDDGKKFNIFCDKNKGPCFVGMFAVQEQILNGKGLVNHLNMQCFEGENEKYEINGGKNEFVIEEMEVFQVIIKTNL